MSADFFLDTNIVVYSFDLTQTGKQNTAKGIIEKALRSDEGIISFQVVQEFLNVATRKFSVPMPTTAASRYLREVLEPLCSVYPTIPLYEQALTLQDRWRYSFYDSLIIAAALYAHCTTLYSEDLQHGQVIGSLTIVNPFIDAQSG